MGTLSQLMVFKVGEDARKFFYPYENVVTKGLTEEDQTEIIVVYLDGEAFDFYFERFTMYNWPTPEAKNYQVAKDVMLKKFSSQKSKAESWRMQYRWTTKDATYIPFWRELRKSRTKPSSMDRQNLVSWVKRWKEIPCYSNSFCSEDPKITTMWRNTPLSTPAIWRWWKNPSGSMSQERGSSHGRILQESTHRWICQ